MTVGQREHIGWEVRCDSPACSSTTAASAPRRYRSGAYAALAAARMLGWVHLTKPSGDVLWYCPFHQRFDEAALRWVPAVPPAA